jgi:beta-glucanase (GH16 family)
MSSRILWRLRRAPRRRPHSPPKRLGIARALLIAATICGTVGASTLVPAMRGDSEASASLLVKSPSPLSERASLTDHRKHGSRTRTTTAAASVDSTASTTGRLGIHGGQTSTTATSGATTATMALTTGAPPSAAASPLSLTPPPGYSDLVFDNEFSGSSLDTAKWNTCYRTGTCTNAGNHEQEWYYPSQCQVSGGELHLVAQQQPNSTYPYKSCLVTTDNKFDFTYGFVQIRAQMPAGQSLWPALWLVPRNNSWPPEIDIMEMLGQATHTLVVTYHAPNYQTPQDNYYGADLTGWHTYGLAWSPGVLTWYLDGQEVFQTTDDVTAKSMYLIINLAVGGTWPGMASSATPASASMNVDYVRVWK